MMTRATTALALAGALAVAGASAAAEGANCAGLADVLAALAIEYHEQPLFTGLAPNGTRVIVVANPDASTWSVLVTRDPGLACLVASGPSWAAGETQPKGVEG